jgi:hypothetical protein
MEKRHFLTYTILLILALIVLPVVSGFEFEKNAINDVIAAENISIPASYYLTVHNTNNFNESFRIYSILNMELEPKDPFMVEAGKEATILVKMLPSSKVKERCGLRECSIQYYIRGEQSDAVADALDIKIVPIDKIINADTQAAITHESKVLLINVTNKENINLEKISLNVEGSFCGAAKNISLAPKSSTTVIVDIDQSKLKALEAGNYTIKLTFLANNEYSYTVEKQVKLEEFSSITTTESLRVSFLGYTKTITKKNEGNAPELVTIEVKQNKFENTFTGYSVETAYKQPGDNGVAVGWQRQLEPGESMMVELKTNYTLPILFLIAIVAGSTTFYIQRRPRVVVKKKAYKVRTTTGVPALKIVLLVKNIGSEISGVVCTDYMPKMTELHERFGAAQPDVIDKTKMRWNFGTLLPDEEKAVSYIVYSKVAPLGMNFPKAVVGYMDYKGKSHYTFSNNIAAFEA